MKTGMLAYLAAGLIENRQEAHGKRTHRQEVMTGDGEWGHKGAETGYRDRAQRQGAGNHKGW
jgi:hypothetical protein